MVLYLVLLYQMQQSLQMIIKLLLMKLLFQLLLTVHLAGSFVLWAEQIVQMILNGNRVLLLYNYVFILILDLFFLKLDVLVPSSSLLLVCCVPFSGVFTDLLDFEDVMNILLHLLWDQLIAALALNLCVLAVILLRYGLASFLVVLISIIVSVDPIRGATIVLSSFWY